MCDECFWFEEHERMSYVWNNGGAESVARAYHPLEKENDHGSEH